MADLTIYQKEDGVVVWVHRDLGQQEKDSLISQMESHHSYREEASPGMNYKWNGTSFEKLPDEVQSAWNFIRDKRITELQLSDWTQAVDSPLSDSKKQNGLLIVRHYVIYLHNIQKAILGKQ